MVKDGAKHAKGPGSILGYELHFFFSDRKKNRYLAKNVLSNAKMVATVYEKEICVAASLSVP